MSWYVKNTHAKKSQSYDFGGNTKTLEPNEEREVSFDEAQIVLSNWFRLFQVQERN